MRPCRRPAFRPRSRPRGRTPSRSGARRASSTSVFPTGSSLRSNVPRRSSASSPRSWRGSSSSRAPAVCCTRIGGASRLDGAPRLAAMSAATASRVSPARRVAYDVVRRTFEDGAHTDRALRAEAARAGLEGRELAFAMRLAYETVQRRRTLDAVIAELARRDVERLDPPVPAALRLGLLQLAFLDCVADHAALDQAVELA